MTKNERMNIIRLRGRLLSAHNNLKGCAIDYDCTWPKSIVKQLKECLDILNEFKV